MYVGGSSPECRAMSPYPYHFFLRFRCSFCTLFPNMLNTYFSLVYHQASQPSNEKEALDSQFLSYLGHTKHQLLHHGMGLRYNLKSPVYQNQLFLFCSVCLVQWIQAQHENMSAQDQSAILNWQKIKVVKIIIHMAGKSNTCFVKSVNSVILL